MQYIYKELVCIEKYNDGLNVEFEDNRSATDRFPSQNRPISSYLNILGGEGWDVIGITGGITKLGRKFSGLQKMRLKILKIDKLFPDQPDSKKIYILLKRPK